jgi:branched-chain amino acid transport system ATP-binding protein
MTTVLETEGVTKRFGEFTAVDDVSMQVMEGERRAIIGPNGAGKSTYFNLLSGHLRPTAGKVTLFGQDVTGNPPETIARLGVGRSFQVTSVFPELCVRENVQIALLCRDGRTRRLWGRAWRQMREEADEIMDAVGLSGLGESHAGVLSHGDQRSLELALSLALRPKLLFLDEPTAGMAPEETLKAMELVRRLATEYELTLVFTEHDMEVVFSTAQRVTVLAQGRVLAEGTPDEVRSNPAVREVYLGGADDE